MQNFPPDNYDSWLSGLRIMRMKMQGGQTSLGSVLSPKAPGPLQVSAAPNSPECPSGGTHAHGTASGKSTGRKLQYLPSVLSLLTLLDLSWKLWGQCHQLLRDRDRLQDPLNPPLLYMILRRFSLAYFILRIQYIIHVNTKYVFIDY